MLNIHFPLFDRKEAKSKEIRLVNEGLQLHDQIALVADPDDADYILLLQNHLYHHNPFHKDFWELKESFNNKTILLDYDDWPGQVFGRRAFNWCCYFKRSVVDKQCEESKLKHYDGLPIEPISYAAMHNYLMQENELPRAIDVACLFNNGSINHEFNGQGRGRVLSFLRSKPFPGKTTLFDTVSEHGPAGRAKECPVYFDTLQNTKILITCNPGRWEGDSRLWEALASGCLVFVDRMLTPTINPLVDNQHLVYYDLSDAGLEKLYRQITYYLVDDEKRNQISNAGYTFVKNNHMSVNRIQQVINKIEFLNANFD